MFKLDTSKYGKEYYENIYKSLVEDGRKEFKNLLGSVSAFHEILIDRVADAYVGTLMSDDSQIKVDIRKDKTERLQKWLNLSFSELHSSSNESISRRIFYKNLAEAIKQTVSDIVLRQKIFDALSAMRKKVKDHSTELSDESAD